MRDQGGCCIFFSSSSSIFFLKAGGLTIVYKMLIYYHMNSVCRNLKRKNVIENCPNRFFHNNSLRLCKSDIYFIPKIDKKEISALGKIGKSVDDFFFMWP